MDTALMQTTVPATDDASRRAPAASATFKVLGIPVNAVQIPDAIAVLERWIAERGPARYVAVTGMHGVTEALTNDRFRNILKNAGMVVSDGMPLVWLGKIRGFANMQRRVYGPELTETFFQQTGSKYRHFFYGGAEGVGVDLGRKYQELYGAQIAGSYSPPFRPLTLEEDAKVCAMIHDSGADIVWVGLSTPKQETWMYDHRDKLNVPAMLGIGAAFDLNTGRLVQAPRWMRENGLEWLFRLLAEPKRLWKRYLILIPKFLGNVLLELSGLRKYD